MVCGTKDVDPGLRMKASVIYIIYSELQYIIIHQSGEILWKRNIRCINNINTKAVM